MIAIGQYNTLKILRSTSIGLYLGDESGEDVLLPDKYCPEQYSINDPIEVFVYRDYAGRKVATNLTPEILLHEFALLEVSAVSDVGAFLDWGMEKDLLVPFREQTQEMKVGRWYVVYLDVDEKTDRLYASARVEKFLGNTDLTVAEGETVDLLVYRETDLGFSVIVNNQHKGLLYKNEVFQHLRTGDKLKGFVKKIREENKLDVSLQPIGFEKTNSSNTELILQALQLNDGFLEMTDKSSPEDIYAQFGISKKAFKKAVGALYKERKIIIEDAGIRLA